MMIRPAVAALLMLTNVLAFALPADATPTILPPAVLEPVDFGEDQTVIQWTLPIDPDAPIQGFSVQRYVNGVGPTIFLVPADQFEFTDTEVPEEHEVFVYYVQYTVQGPADEGSDGPPSNPLSRSGHIRCRLFLSLLPPEPDLRCIMP